MKLKIIDNIIFFPNHSYLSNFYKNIPMGISEFIVSVG